MTRETSRPSKTRARSRKRAKPGSTSRPVSRQGAEPKPPWSAVPREIKDEVARVLRSPVTRAERVYGGYAPSATFRLKLANGKRAFFKASYPAPKGSGVKWVVDVEDRNYRRLSRLMSP